MDEHIEPPLKYYDRHAADWSPPEPVSRGPGCLVPIDGLLLFWPIWLVLLALGFGTPIVAAVSSGSSSGHYAVGVAFYGGFFAAYLMIPWGAAYLLARLVSLATGGAVILAAGLAGLAAAVLLVVTGVLWWSSLLIAIPSLSAMLSAAVRIRALR